MKISISMGLIIEIFLKDPEDNPIKQKNKKSEKTEKRS
jgi:hypothetical protein